MYVTLVLSRRLQLNPLCSCNDVGYFQEGPPGLNQTAVVTRLVQPDYDERQCAYFFPEQFGNNTLPVPNVAATNAFYHGWDVKVDRLFIANGQRMCSSEFTNAYANPEVPR